MSSVAEQHQPAELILNVRCPDHGEVILQNQHDTHIMPRIPVFLLFQNGLIHPGTYSGYCVGDELPVCPLHHLIAVIIGVQGPVVLQGGAGSEHHLCVEVQRTHPVPLLQPVALQPAPKAFWDSGYDGVSVVFITFISRSEIY